MRKAEKVYGKISSISFRTPGLWNPVYFLQEPAETVHYLSQHAPGHTSSLETPFPCVPRSSPSIRTFPFYDWERRTAHCASGYIKTRRLSLATCPYRRPFPELPEAFRSQLPVGSPAWGLHFPALSGAAPGPGDFPFDASELRVSHCASGQMEARMLSLAASAYRLHFPARPGAAW